MSRPRPSCPLCLAAIDEYASPCADCGTPYHAACWSGDCVIAGCVRKAAPPPPDTATEGLRTWMRWSFQMYFAGTAGWVIQYYRHVRMDEIAQTSGIVIVASFASLWVSTVACAVLELVIGSAARRRLATPAVLIMAVTALFLVFGIFSRSIDLTCLEVFGAGWILAFFMLMAASFTDEDKSLANAGLVTIGLVCVLFLHSARCEYQ